MCSDGPNGDDNEIENEDPLQPSTSKGVKRKSSEDVVRICQYEHCTEIATRKLCSLHKKKRFKKFKCSHDGCEQFFTTNHNMQRHVNAMHLGIKDVLCSHEGCQQMFNGKGAMQQHVKAVHFSIRDIVCSHDGCDQMFSQKVHMQRHVRAVHLGYSRYSMLPRWL
eukprot:5265-Heterococcus_DN1.PRE.20